MVDDERVARVLQRVRDDVSFLRRLAEHGAALLDDETALAAVKYRLVTAIEGCARVAHHLAVSEGWAAPETNADAFRELARREVLDVEAGEALARAAGFRNLLVHQYGDIDDRRVVDYLTRLDDLDRFARSIAAWVTGSGGGSG